MNSIVKNLQQAKLQARTLQSPLQPTRQSTQHSNWLEDFVSTYQNLNHNNLSTLADIYHSDVQFVDPLHQIHGLTDLTIYFEHLYENLISSEFVLTYQLAHDNPIDSQQQQAAIYWQMHLRHKKLNSGNTITVEGHSLLRRQEERVIYHRDYFDIGSMIYEHLPVLGGIVKLIKRKASDQ